MAKVQPINADAASGQATGKSGRTNKRSSAADAKAAFRELRESAGTLDAAAAVVRVRRSQLCAYGNADEPEHHAPLDVVEALTRATQNPVVAQYLANIAGHIIVPVDARGTCIARMVPELARKGGGAIATLVEHSLDGVIDQQEAVEGIRPVEDMLMLCARLLVELRAKANGDV